MSNDCWLLRAKSSIHFQVPIQTIQISIKDNHACTEWSRSSFKGTKMGLENE